MIFQMHSHFCS